MMSYNLTRHHPLPQKHNNPLYNPLYMMFHIVSSTYVHGYVLRSMINLHILQLSDWCLDGERANL